MDGKVTIYYGSFWNFHRSVPYLYTQGAVRYYLVFKDNLDVNLQYKISSDENHPKTSRECISKIKSLIDPSKRYKYKFRRVAGCLFTHFINVDKDDLIDPHMFDISSVA